MYVFIDMDGVLTAFAESAIKLITSVDPAAVLRGWPKGEYHMPTVLGISNDEFWGRIEAAGEEFWASMAPYPWAMQLYDDMLAFGKRIILTSPSRDPHCVAGKLRWMQGFFPAGKRFGNYIFTTSERKCLLAGPGRILLDDNPQNIKQWTEAGGHAVLVPQPWNAAEAVSPDEMLGYLVSQVAGKVGSA